MIQGTWGIRVDVDGWACLVNWTSNPALSRVVVKLPPAEQRPPVYTPEEAWELGQALCTAAAYAMEGVTPEDAVATN
jgi:hypothetical protein